MSTNTTNANGEIKAGDDVQWNYGGGHPSGTVAEVNAEAGGKIEIETAKGNTIHKNSDPENPAVRIGTEEGKSDVVKRASELTKTADGGGGEEGGAKPADEAEVGEKRERETDEVEGATAGKEASEPAVGANEAEKLEKGEEAVEKEEGKEPKKAKLDESADAGTTPVEEKHTGEGEGDGAAAHGAKGAKRGKGRGRGGKAATQPTRTSTRTTRGSKAAEAKAADAAKATESEGTLAIQESARGDAPPMEGQVPSAAEGGAAQDAARAPTA